MSTAVRTLTALGAALGAQALSGCESFNRAEGRLQSLKGGDVVEALEILGPPDEEATRDGRAIYGWRSDGAGSEVFGGRVVMAPISCRLEIAADAEGMIAAAALRGEFAACRRFDAPLRALADIARSAD